MNFVKITEFITFNKKQTILTASNSLPEIMALIPSLRECYGENVKIFRYLKTLPA